MELEAMPRIEVGAIVRFEAPGSRSQDNGPRMVPAIVINVWPDLSLQLFALHFEGSFLVNSIPRDQVVPVLSRSMLYGMFAGFDERLRVLEHQLAGHATEASREPKPGTLAHTFAAEAEEARMGMPLKFQLADDTTRDQSGPVARS